VRNYFGGLHQFPTNIHGRYRVAVIGDVVLSGTGQRPLKVDYFLGTASRRGVTDAFYLGPALSVAEAESWPHSSLTTWCLYPPPSNGNGREDLRAAPPGFVITRPGYMMPVFLHHYSHPHATNTATNRHEVDAAVHLVAGLPYPGCKELNNGGYEISIGTFPIAAAIVELNLSESGELECCMVNYDTLPPSRWP